jgi:hypothetical protein
VFANCSKKEEIFPLTTPEIAEAQKADSKLKHCFKRNAVLDKGLDVRLADNTYVVCKDGRMINPKPLQRGAVLWCHPTTCSTHDTPNLKRQLKLQCTGRACAPQSGQQQSHADHAKSIRKQKLKYGHLPSKIVITIPWRALCVDLIGPYTLKGKDDGTVIDFLALMMIDPTTSWFEVVELPLIRQLKTVTFNGKE